MYNDIRQYISQNKTLLWDTLQQLCAIPAPSHFEHQRAAYCKSWLENAGAQGVYIDNALNVIFPLHCDGSRDITVFAAHTDTVFPDRQPMPYTDDGKRIHCPGAADDTASVAVLLLMAKYFLDNRLTPPHGILFVCNSCEEGLGNLKGTRQLFADFRSRIGTFISFDSNLDTVADRCVGSHRYEVEALTQGGHSFGNFGRANAIAALSGVVGEIYKLDVPHKPGTRTTYNVGTISGGTSVNTIAQSASMLCEYRSDDWECLALMQAQFERIFAAACTPQVQLRVEKVGDRPCGNVDEGKIAALRQLTVPIIEDVIGRPVTCTSSSTDCNIPLSLGVPALCVGVNTHAGIHTRQEWVDKNSLLSGLEVAIRLGRTLGQV